MDGRVLDELLRPELRGDIRKQEAVAAAVSSENDYDQDEDALIQQRLADLGYL
jgi:hypothetical protein